MAQGAHAANLDEAAFYALLEGLRLAQAKGAGSVEVFTDSQLVYRVLTADWGAEDDWRDLRQRAQDIQDLAAQAQGLLSTFEAFALRWIPREDNRHAAGMCKLGSSWLS